MHYLLGNSYADFMIRFKSYISQIDHASAGFGESKLSDSTKTYQLVIAFRCEALDVALASAITTPKNSDDYPTYIDTCMKLKTTIASINPGEGTEVKGKKGSRVNAVGGNGGNNFGNQATVGGNTPKSTKPGGPVRRNRKCWKCEKEGKHIASTCTKCV
jgi:hypothetical protein